MNEVRSTDFLLFHDESGACSRLIKLTCVSEMNDKDFDLIDRILLKEHFSANVPNFESFVKKFVEWGAEFIFKMIEKNLYINRLKKIMSHIEYLFDLLPVNSRILNTNFIDKKTLVVLLGLFRINSPKNPGDYVYIFSKLWILCETQIRDDEVMSPALNGVYELLKAPKSINLIGEIFQYAEKLLTMHCSRLDFKIVNLSVIENLLNIVKVVVQNENHAIVRLHFWWRFISSIDAEAMCKTLFLPIVIPFLANIFGKYLTFDPETKFSYSLYPYNCFSNHQALGPLCNHVMLQLLLIFGKPDLPNIRKSQLFNGIKHYRNFANFLITEKILDSILMSVYYWCQTIQLDKSKLVLSPFHLLGELFKCLSKRLIVSFDINKSTSDEKPDVTNSDNIFHRFINKMITLKKRLEKDFESNASIHIPPLTGNIAIVQPIISALHTIGDVMSYTHSGLELLLGIFCEHLSDMNKLILSDNHASLNNDSSWLDNSKMIIDLIFPMKSLAFSLIMSRDIDMINKHWFQGWFDKDFKSVTVKKGFIVNMQCWYYLSSKMFRRLDKDSFTMYSDDESNLQFSTFTQYLAAPIFLMLQIKDGVLTKTNYNNIWKIWQHLYIDLITKAQLIPDFNSGVWYESILSLLKKILLTMKAEDPSMLACPLAFNMVCRCLRLIVLRSNDKIMDNHSTFRALLIDLCDNFPSFSNENIKLNHKNLTGDDDDVDIFDDFPSTPNSKWAKLKMPLTSHFQCDLDSNLDTFLSLMKAIISRIGIDRTSVLDIVTNIHPQLALLSAVIHDYKPSFDNFFRPTRSRIVYDENLSQFEQFLIHFLNRIEMTCFKQPKTMDVVNKITPLLTYIFTFKPGVLSRSMIQTAINFWNDLASGPDNNSSTIEYSDDFVQVLWKLKATHKMIEIPETMMQKISEMKDNNFELTRQDSQASLEKLKIVPVGSFLNKYNGNDSVQLTPTKSVENTDGNLVSPSISSTITPTKPQKSRQKNNPIKEFSSPSLDIVKKVNRKRSCFDLSRKSSDAEYVVIPPSKNKRLRLTEHQKESFLEKKNEYKPDLFSRSDSIASKMSLISQDSETNLTDASTDDLSSINLKGTTDIDATDSILDKNYTPPKICSQITSKLNESSIITNTESIALSVDIDDKVDETDMIKESSNIDNKENQDISTNQIKDSPSPTKASDVLICNNESISENKIENKSTKEVSPVIVNDDDKSSKMNIPIKLSPRQPLNSYLSPLPGVLKTFPLRNITPTSSPITSSTSKRTQRLVQLALDNQIKKEKTVKLPVIRENEEPPKQGGIIRHLLSQSKKSARVSFNIPIDDSNDRDESNGNENIESINDDGNYMPHFLSPIPEKAQESASIISRQFCVDLNKSLLDEGNSPTEIPETLAISDCIVVDKSKNSFVDAMEIMENLFATKSEEEKKEMLRELCKFIGKQI